MSNMQFDSFDTDLDKQYHKVSKLHKLTVITDTQMVNMGILASSMTLTFLVISCHSMYKMVLIMIAVEWLEKVKTQICN